MHLLVLHYGAAILKMRPIDRYETKPRFARLCGRMPAMSSNGSDQSTVSTRAAVRRHETGANRSPTSGHRDPVPGAVIRRIASKTQCALRRERIASTRTFGTI